MMIFIINKFVREYKKALVRLVAFELCRGLLIVLAAWLLTEGIINSDFGISLLVVMIGRVIIDNVRSRHFNDLSLKFQEEIRQKLHRQWFNRSQAGNSGELLTLMFDTVEAFDDFFVRALPNIFTVLVVAPMIIIVAAVLDPLTAVIFILTLPVAPFLLYLIGGAISKRNQQALLKLTKLNAEFKELIAAITTLKIFRQSEAALKRLELTSTQSAGATLEALKLVFVSAFALELITTLSIALVAVVVGLRLIDDSINFEVALFMLMLSPEMYSPIRQLGSGFHAVVKARDSVNLLKDRILSFNQEDSRHVYKENFNDFTVVIGESGSGKSTFLKELVKEYNNETVAYLPQQPHLFKDSIRNNVSLFKDIDDSLIYQVLHDVKLNLNLDSSVEGLSRGELQRLGLARVLIKASINITSPPIIILDEPTAALDINTKQVIINIIIKLSHHNRLIIATHDQEIINLAGQIINLNHSSPISLK